MPLVPTTTICAFVGGLTIGAELPPPQELNPTTKNRASVPMMACFGLRLMVTSTPANTAANAKFKPSKGEWLSRADNVVATLNVTGA